MDCAVNIQLFMLQQNTHKTVEVENFPAKKYY